MLAKKSEQLSRFDGFEPCPIAKTICRKVELSSGFGAENKKALPPRMGQDKRSRGSTQLQRGRAPSSLRRITAPAGRPSRSARPQLQGGTLAPWPRALPACDARSLPPGFPRGFLFYAFLLAAMVPPCAPLVNPAGSFSGKRNESPEFP